MALSVLATVAIISNTNGAGFDYPPGAPPPFIAAQFIYGPSSNTILEFESPIQLRITSILDQTAWNCLAVYEEIPLDILTRKPPIVRADTDTINQYSTPETKFQCTVYAALPMLNHLVPETVTDSQALYDSWGMDPPATPEIHPDIVACGVDDIDCLQNVAISNNYEPFIMGSIIALQAIDYLENDGFNADGSINRNGDGECTANCRPFSDITGYEPADPKDKANDDRWQPLQEDNGKGFFYKYDHVIPHVGFTGALRFETRQSLRDRKASDPEYDYVVESQKVIDRLAHLAVDDRQKMLVEFFDDKIAATTAVVIALNNDLQWTYEQRLFYLVGVTTAEYEAMIIAWREKRIWDLVRPTTLIKNGILGDEIETYGGPYQGVKTIKSKDFESYIRVMPHSEYPSGSGCICLALTQFTEKVLNEKFGIDDMPIPIPPQFFPGTTFPAGSSKIEPGVTPAVDFFELVPGLEEFSDLCSQSRLWGGMHFDAAIDGSMEVCDGVGYNTFDFLENILNGNVDAFGEEYDEPIPPFEDEYELEIKLTKGIKKKDKNKKKKKKDDAILAIFGMKGDDDEEGGSYHYRTYTPYIIVSMFASIFTALAITVMIYCLYKRKSKDKSVEYDKVINDEDL